VAEVASYQNPDSHGQVPGELSALPTPTGQL